MRGVTFRVQGSGRIEVEVPAEKGDEVRGHRSPPSLEKPDTLTLSLLNATAVEVDVFSPSAGEVLRG